MTNEVFIKLGEEWLIKWQFLKDVYYMLVYDIRFMSPKNANTGILYTKMEKHLWDNYQVKLNERQLRHLVKRVRDVSQLPPV